MNFGTMGRKQKAEVDKILLSTSFCPSFGLAVT
jgi:hypothetical protein